MKIKRTLAVEVEFEIDDDANLEAGLEDVIGAIRIATSTPVSLGAGAVELGEIVKSVQEMNFLTLTKII